MTYQWETILIGFLPTYMNLYNCTVWVWGLWLIFDTLFLFANYQKTWRMNWRLLFFLLAFVALVLRGNNILERILYCYWELLILVLSFNLPRLKFLTYKIWFIPFWIMMRVRPRWETFLSLSAYCPFCWGMLSSQVAHNNGISVGSPQAGSPQEFSGRPAAVCLLEDEV